MQKTSLLTLASTTSWNLKPSAEIITLRRITSTIGLCRVYQYNNTFVCHSGSYHFNRMKFVLTNAPEKFQRSLDIFLVTNKCKTCLVYLYYIIIFSKDAESHFKHVYEIRMALYRSNEKIKLKKCELYSQKFRYLGHIVEPGWLWIDDVVFKTLKEAENLVRNRILDTSGT